MLSLQPHRFASALTKSAVAVAVALACASAQAQTTTIYDFGVSLSGPASPSASFATLSSTQSADGRNYTFSLSLASNFGSLFGNTNAYIRTVLFNTNATDPIPSSVALASGTWGVNAISYSANAPQVGSISFDFTETFGANAGNNSGNRLTSGESVNWFTNFTNPTNFVVPEFALHVQSIGSNGDSGWYTPAVTTPIPEPQTYAMLLAGLGMLGFAVRRRNRKESVGA